MLELYYGLRQSVLHGSPVIFPILFDDVLNDINDPELWAAKLLRDHCFHVPFESPEKAVDKIRWFLSELEFGIKEDTIGHGKSFKDIYTAYVKKLGGKRVNSGVAKMLEDLPGQKHITLENNYIGDVGLKALCHVIDMKPDLLQLNLKGNGISNAGLHSLVDTLVCHPSITSIDLSHNDISNAGATELFWLVRRNEQITAINMQDTSIKCVWQKRIKTKLQENQRLPLAAWKVDCDAALAAPSEIQFATEDITKTAVKWLMVLTVTPLAEGPAFARLQVRAVTTVTEPNGNREERSVDFVDPEQSGHPILEGIRQYLKDFERNTIAVSRFVGTTVKLVLENVGEGMEALQMQLREHFLQASPGLAERLRDGGDHLVEFRLLCNAADTRDRFFMEGTVAFKGEERVAKKLMKLYRDNIARCKGNLRDEIEWLVPQMLCAELMEEEELEALTRLEEEEVRKEKAEEERLMDSVVTYWKCTPAVFKKSPNGHFDRWFREAARSVAAASPTARAGLPGHVATQVRQYEVNCIADKDHPPYAY